MASSDCLNASGEASCIKTREWGGPPARIRRKYRRLEASPARGATVASLTRKGSLVLTVSATSVGSGGGGATGVMKLNVATESMHNLEVATCCMGLETIAKPTILLQCH